MNKIDATVTLIVVVLTLYAGMKGTSLLVREIATRRGNYKEILLYFFCHYFGISVLGLLLIKATLQNH